MSANETESSPAAPDPEEANTANPNDNAARPTTAPTADQEQAPKRRHHEGDSPRKPITVSHPSSRPGTQSSKKRPHTQPGRPRPTHFSRWRKNQEELETLEDRKALCVYFPNYRPPVLTKEELDKSVERLSKVKKKKSTDKDGEGENKDSANETPAHNKEGDAPKKVKGCSERLAGTKPKEKIPLPPLVPRKQLNEEEFQKHLDSLYAAPLAKQQKWKERVNEIIQTKPAKQLQMTEEEIKEKIAWLAQGSVESQRKKRQHLNEAYLKRNVHQPNGKKQYQDKQQRDTTTSRLYSKSLEHEKEVTEKLTVLYSPPRQSAKRSAAEWEGTIGRLAVTK